MVRSAIRYFELAIEELPEGRWICREKMSPHFWIAESAEKCAVEAIRNLVPKLRLCADGGDGERGSMEWDAILG